MRIAVICTCPKNIFSGGRYHAFQITQSLSKRGHECYFITNNTPIFAKELKETIPQNPTSVILVNKEFQFTSLSPFDAVFLAPQMGEHSYLHRAALSFARKTGAVRFMINFESPNWFNKLSPIKRSEELWKDWNYLPSFGCNILSSTHESMKYAKKYYKNLPPNTDFSVWQPSINSEACHRAKTSNPKKRILFFTRFKDKHKGGDDIKNLFHKDFKGYAFSFIVGNEEKSKPYIEQLSKESKDYGIQIEIHNKVTDKYKFDLLKNSSAIVFSSYFEGYGYPPMEALASDIPCVAYDLPVLRENCKNLIYYAPLGNTTILREQLLKALKEGPKETSKNPHVHNLTDIYERGLALEKVIKDYKEKVKNSFSTKLKKPRISTSHYSILKNGPFSTLCFQLASNILVKKISPWKDFFGTFEFHPGNWLNEQKNYTIFITFKKSLRNNIFLNKKFYVHFEDETFPIPLPKPLNNSFSYRNIPKETIGFNQLKIYKKSAHLTGWAFPAVDYDKLFLLDNKGSAVNLFIGEKNKKAPKHFLKKMTKKFLLKKNKESYFGFSGEINLNKVDLSKVNLIFLKNEKIMGTFVVSLNLMQEEKKELECIDLSEGQASEIKINNSLKTLPYTITPINYTENSLAYRVKTPSSKDLAFYYLQRIVPKIFAFFQKKETSVMSPSLRWSINSSKFSYHRKEISIQGWVLSKDIFSIEIWNANEYLGEAETEIPRENLAKKLNIEENINLGFAFQHPYDSDLIKEIRVRLITKNQYGQIISREKRYSREKILAVNSQEEKPVITLKREKYDEEWKVLWLQGSFSILSHFLTPTKISLVKNFQEISSGALKHINERKNGGLKLNWEIESQINFPLVQDEIVSVRLTYEDSSFHDYPYNIHDLIFNRNSRIKNHIHSSYEAKDLLIFLTEGGASLRKDCTDYILLLVHNLDAVERPEKRAFFEELRSQLLLQGKELVLLHHSKNSSKTNIPEINLFSENLNSYCELLYPSKKRIEDKKEEEEAEEEEKEEENLFNIPYLEENRTFEHCKEMLRGFLSSQGASSKKTNNISSLLTDEALKIETVIRRTNPRLVLLWHQWNSFCLLGRECANFYKIPSYFIHEGMLPGTITLDEKGMMAEANCVGVTLARNEENAFYLEQAMKTIKTIKIQGLDRKPFHFSVSGEGLLRNLKSSGKKIVFYAGINDWQSGNLPASHQKAKVHSPHYTDTLEALEALLDVAEALDFYVIFKIHPNLSQEFTKPVKRKKRLLTLRSVKPSDCIKESDITVTILSSISYNALCYGKPTVLLGRNTLSGTGATYELPSKSHLLETMKKALLKENLSEHLLNFENHTAALLKDHLYPYGNNKNISLLNMEDIIEKMTKYFSHTNEKSRERKNGYLKSCEEKPAFRLHNENSPKI